MKEIILESNKHIYIDYFNLNKKQFVVKRLLVAIGVTYLFFLFSKIIPLPYKSITLLIGMVLSFIVGYKIPYIELISKKNKDILLKQYMFPNFLRYFISVIGTQGNVYKAIKETINYLEEPMKSMVKKLVDDLDNPEKNNRQAFMEFADEIGSSEAIMIMDAINDFDQFGFNKERIKELENIIVQLQQNKTNELIEKKVFKMNRHADPILIYALIYIILFTGVVIVGYMSMLTNIM